MWKPEIYRDFDAYMTPKKFLRIVCVARESYPKGLDASWAADFWQE